MYLPWREKKIFKFWLYKYVYNCKFILTELYYIRKLIENWLKINQIWKIFIEKIIFCLLKTNWIYYIIANNIALVFIVNMKKIYFDFKKKYSNTSGLFRSCFTSDLFSFSELLYEHRRVEIQLPTKKYLYTVYTVYTVCTVYPTFVLFVKNKYIEKNKNGYFSSLEVLSSYPSIPIWLLWQVLDPVCRWG